VPQADRAGVERVSPAVWAGFSMMCIGMFMAVLDIQVVATSLPTIQRAIGIEPDAMSWIQTAYLIAEIVAIPLTGYLTRLLGMRRLFLVGIGVFTLASLGCAASNSFAGLITWRVIQGFFGGTLIPAVFSAVFLLFPFRQQGIATTLAGVLAVLAPTMGPIVGGWITETFSWHWLFLVNVVPGILVALGGAAFLPRAPWAGRLLRELDLASLALMAFALAALEIGLKEAPQRGWASSPVLLLLGASGLAAFVLARRTMAAPHRLLELGMLRDRGFALGSVLSFVSGIGLFGSVYLMPVFLGIVRGHDALQIGTIMLVTGLAQLVSAPVAVALERRVDPRILGLCGFVVFGIGAAMSAFQGIDTDFDGMLWPQILRGSAVMFCLLAPTRIALGHLPLERVTDASGLFNLTRNLGGAIGFALIDTIIYGRVSVHAGDLAGRLVAGDINAARAIGLPLELFTAAAGRPVDEATRALVAPMIERAALTQSINEAWALVAALTLLATVVLPFARAQAAPTRDAAEHSDAARVLALAGD
jgi:DHA2 family multidrug resistance protein